MSERSPRSTFYGRDIVQGGPEKLHLLGIVMVGVGCADDEERCDQDATRGFVHPTSIGSVASRLRDPVNNCYSSQIAAT